MGTEIQISTAEGKIAILISVTEDNIAIFLDPDCKAIPIDGTETEDDGIMILLK